MSYLGIQTEIYSVDIPPPDSVWERRCLEVGERVVNPC